MDSKYAKNMDLLERAKAATPVGAQTYSKSYRYFCQGNSPLFLEKGEGCYVWDVDGNKFVDFICALGAVTVGYNNKRINEAVIKQLSNGISFSQPTEKTIELCEKLIQIIPCAEMVRVVKNGSDATTAAVRLARAYTGRDMVAICGYHGIHDWYIGSTPNNAGVPKDVSALSKTFDYNYIDSLQKLFDEYPNKFAAVIMEPIQSNGPREGYLQQVKDLAHKNGAVLIFDEVVSGFRYALGGAQELYNVVPDMAAVGKGIANGLSVSAVVGKKELIEQIETKKVFISVTYGDEALSVVSALETINILQEPGVYDHFWKIGNIKLEGLKKLIEKYGLGEVMSISGLAPHAGLSYEGVGSLDYLDVQSVFQEKMIENGILTFGAIDNVCVSHTEKEAQMYLQAAELGMEAVKKAIAQDSTKGILKGQKVDPVFKRNIK